MAYYPSQNDLQALCFSEKIILVKLVLLNENYQTIYEMKHEFISGEMSTDTDSDIRNTLSMSLAVHNKNVGIAEDKLLWINKFVKVFVGVKVPFIKDVLWYDKGIFVMTDQTYDAINFTLNINCSDLVCMLNGDVGGSLEGLEMEIKETQYNNIRAAIIATLTSFTPFKKYYVVDMPDPVPYDMEFSASDSVWTMLTALRDLSPGYEMFFDVDGTFVCQKVATLDSDPIVLDNDILQKLYISEVDSGVLKDIRNVSRVWGKCLDTDYNTVTCEYNSSTNTYSAHFVGITLNDDGSLPTSTKFAVKIPAVNTADASKIAIYNKPTADGTETLIGTYSITNSSDKTIGKDFFVANRSFVFRYRRSSMYVMGQWQITAVHKLRNTEPTEEEKKADIEYHACDDIVYTVIPDSPFAIERIGERMGVYQGGEYDDIQAIDDCRTRARWETYRSAKVVYSISLEMVQIPWLQGNEKIRFKLADTEEIKDWIVTSFHASHPSGSMSMTLTEFSPLYDFEIIED